MHFTAIVSLRSVRFHQPCSANGYGGTRGRWPCLSKQWPSLAREGECNPRSVPLTALFVSAAANAPKPSQFRHLLDPQGSMWWGRWRLESWRLSFCAGIAEVLPSSGGHGYQASRLTKTQNEVLTTLQSQSCFLKGGERCLKEPDIPTGISTISSLCSSYGSTLFEDTERCCTRAGTGCHTQSFAVSSPCNPYLSHCRAEQCSQSSSAGALLNRTCKARCMARNNHHFQWPTASCAYLCRLIDYSLLLDKECKQGGAWAKKIVLKSLQSLLVEDPCSQTVPSSRFSGLLTESSLTPTCCMTASMTNGCLPLLCHAGVWFTELKTWGTTVCPVYVRPSYFIHFG